MAGALVLAGALPVLAPEVSGDGARLVAPAYAHDMVLSSSPANGEVVSEFPSEIVFEFSGLVQDDFNTIAITEKATGELVFEGEPTIDGQIVSIKLPAGTAGDPGDYTIGYQITSSDGHPTRGGVEFTYAPEGADEGSEQASSATTAATGASAQASNGENSSAATTEAEASDAANEAEEESSSSSMLLILLIIAAVVLGSVVATTKRKKNNSNES